MEGDQLGNIPDLVEEEATVSFQARILTDEEFCLLQRQNSRLVPEFQATKLEKDAKKHWDLFYKRNETRFFKDRHWTSREFEELVGEGTSKSSADIMLEVGCGVGNLVFPLIEEGFEMFVYACDISAEAIRLLKENPLYDEIRIKAFQADITASDLLQVEIGEDKVKIVTLIFVLSAIHPDKFLQCIINLFRITKPGGILLFRDYGLYDMAQLRFKAGNKIAENFYMRQDGTRSYYFSLEEVQQLFTDGGFEMICNSYIHRRTVNKRKGIDVPRIFVQGKFRKPIIGERPSN